MGKSYVAKTFRTLFCSVEQRETPHTAGRLVSQDTQGIRMLVQCRSCSHQHVYTLPELPEATQVYHIRITGEDGDHLPTALRPAPYLEDSFDLIASSFQEAHERAEFAHSLRFAGQLVRYYINGAVHEDERF